MSMRKAKKKTSAAKSAVGKAKAGNVQKWAKARERAREELGIRGWAVAKKGSPWYVRTKEIYATLR